ncbi:COG2-domain-containing protein [Jaminaea rosea]|uniref:Conserved oligomeric Golgi complex subunit 2 n=1 Tax=Jaminaea rosea TaxID=1569628 RepID=A0A316UZV3_9BASI|nr:COG2-domain-containing protein [Jaminaea rosea]PWN30830.1 COG2-domain-containing protein [Jaminaea rosea]
MAAATSNGYGDPSSSSSASTLPPLPSAAVLSHDHPDLRSPTFSPSNLLCSLLPNSISGIATQLTAYDEDISAELQAVVDAEYRDFVDLASRLAGERQRIDRLANWADGAGQEGLEGVRERVDMEREHVELAQLEVEDLIHSRQHAEERKRHLQLLLAYSDALHRLESLLAIEPPSETGAARSPQERRRSSAATLSGYFAAGSSRDEEDDEDGDIDVLAAAESESEDDDSSEEEEDEAPEPGRINGASGPNGRPSSNQQPLRSQGQVSPSSPRAFDLPTRIFRAKSSWESLSFLKSAALSIAVAESNLDDDASLKLLPFLQAHQERVAAVEHSIKADLRELLARLLTPGSLLVHSTTLVGSAMQLDDLQRWSQVPSSLSVDEKRSRQLEESTLWLYLVFDTWIRISETTEVGISEIQDFVRQKTIRAWAQVHIRPEALGSDMSADPSQADDTSELRSLLLHSSSHQAPIAPLFDRAIRYLYSLRDLTLALEQYSARSPHSLRPLDTIYWPELATAITERLGHHLFFVGRLEEFHRNYETTQRFLESVERLAPSRRAAAAWRSSAAYASFNKRWQLSVYFQMRFREIVSAYEGELAGSSAAATSGSSVAIRVPQLKATQAAVEAFVAPWREGCHLTPLVARQWRLSLMIVSRYHAWLEEQLPGGTRAGSSAAARHLEADSQQPRSSLDGAGRPGAATPAPDHAESYAQDEKTLRTLVILVADALWFQAEVARRFESAVLPCLPTAQPGSQELADISTEMRSALTSTFPFTSTLLLPISTRLTSILKSRCAEPLRLVRSVSSTSYRSSGSSTPNDSSTAAVEPSYFVPQILRSLRHFLGKGDRQDEKFLTAATLVDEGIKTGWATSVVEDVAVRYAASLTQMIQNYESLRRLKRGTGAGGGGGGFGGLASSLLGRGKQQPQSTAGDAGRDVEGERMHAQLRADVDRLELDVKELEQVGVKVDLEASEAWKGLREVVKEQR